MITSHKDANKQVVNQPRRTNATQQNEKTHREKNHIDREPRCKRIAQNLNCIK